MGRELQNGEYGRLDVVGGSGVCEYCVSKGYVGVAEAEWYAVGF